MSHRHNELFQFTKKNIYESEVHGVSTSTTISSPAIRVVSCSLLWFIRLISWQVVVAVCVVIKTPRLFIGQRLRHPKQICFPFSFVSMLYKLSGSSPFFLSFFSHSHFHNADHITDILALSFSSSSSSSFAFPRRADRMIAKWTAMWGNKTLLWMVFLFKWEGKKFWIEKLIFGLLTEKGRHMAWAEAVRPAWLCMFVQANRGKAKTEKLTSPDKYEWVWLVKNVLGLLGKSQWWMRSAKWSSALSGHSNEKKKLFQLMACGSPGWDETPGWRTFQAP